jgi:hypothetical protein
MNILKIKSTKLTPEIVMDPTNHVVEIKGFSFPEDAQEFYQPIINWLKEYKEEYSNNFKDNNELKVYFKLVYFNSASTRLLVEIFELLNKMLTGGYSIKVYWHYDIEDPKMGETGNELSEITKVPVQIISYN